MDLIVTNPRALCSYLRDVSGSPAYSFDESTFGLQVNLATYARNHCPHSATTRIVLVQYAIGSI